MNSKNPSIRRVNSTRLARRSSFLVALGWPAGYADRYANVNMRSYLIPITLVLSGCASVRDAFVIPELHAIGIYEGADVEDDGQAWWPKCETGMSGIQCHQKMVKRKQEVGGTVIVNVSIIDKPLILSFSSYDKTKWIVKAEENVIIERVILSGYHSQSVTGIRDETPIEVYTYESSPCRSCYQGSGYFYSYKAPPSSKLKEITGLDVTSWQGRYTGKEFSIFPGIRRVRNR